LQIKASSRFLRKAKKLKEPHATMLRAVLRRLAVDPRDPILGTHRLRGELDGYWACTVDDDLRLLFRLQNDELFLVNLGNHDQVY
jgi:addiction module toxin, RelE/StbE family